MPEYRIPTQSGMCPQPMSLGAETGIDGVMFFRDLDRKEVRKIVVSVKGGGIKPDDVSALNHVRER